ncbi:hypothetical protein CALVIDRAFT_267112 [Calocera viscosa TUFC12733]|uniref:GATA-type domain-containing protein n=1 Tax=Calocera viscosa (strain TUFC12733) TaxID=1330018 RepID=A0A167IXL7_CALVF|nr:hypothetical protein CALVIDRAFT_267112 [Calocera viscosa TUFC12733]
MAQPSSPHGLRSVSPYSQHRAPDDQGIETDPATIIPCNTTTDNIFLQAVDPALLPVGTPYAQPNSPQVPAANAPIVLSEASASDLYAPIDGFPHPQRFNHVLPPFSSLLLDGVPEDQKCNNCFIRGWSCNGRNPCAACVMGRTPCTRDPTQRLVLVALRHALQQSTTQPAHPFAIPMPPYPHNPMTFTPSPSPEHRSDHPASFSTTIKRQEEVVATSLQVDPMPPRAGGSSRVMQDLAPEEACQRCGKRGTGFWRHDKKGRRICPDCVISTRRPPPQVQNYRVGGPCARCGATLAPVWRRGPKRELLCNACGLRRADKTADGNSKKARK